MTDDEIEIQKAAQQYAYEATRPGALAPAEDFIDVKLAFASGARWMAEQTKPRIKELEEYEFMYKGLEK